jgi:hypothetical protein
MTEDQLKLYEQWKDVESRLRGTVIQYSDIQTAKELRPRVWEFRSHLSVAERFEVGSSLEKSLKEIFDRKYPPDSWPLSKQWATRAIHRASGGFNFILECLEYIHRGGTDPAYSRPAYILLSYHSELLLESYLLLKEEHTKKTKEELEALLKGKHNHDLKDLADKIGKESLVVLGIKTVGSETKNDLKRYVMTLANGDKIIVEDSVTVRYDFKYDRRRDIDPDESERMRSEVGHLLEMTNKVMQICSSR